MIKKYFTIYFLFSTGVGAYTRFDRAVGWFSLALIVVGAVLSFLSRRTKDRAVKMLIGKWTGLLLTMGILSGLWWGMRDQGVAVLSSHIILYVLYLIGLVWLVNVLRFQFGAYRKMRDAEEKNAIKQKYLEKR